MKCRVSHVQTEPVSFTVQEIHPFPLLLHLPHGPDLLTDPFGRAICPRKPSALAMPCLLARCVRLRENTSDGRHLVIHEESWGLYVILEVRKLRPRKTDGLAPQNPSVSAKAETRTQISLSRSHVFPPHSESRSVELPMLR